MLIGLSCLSYKKDARFYIIDVNEGDSKEVGFNPKQLKQIKQIDKDVLKTAVRIGFFNGYTTEDIDCAE